MPSTTLDPTAEGALTAWSLSGAATKTLAVTDNSDASYIFIDTAAGSQSFEFQDLPAGASSIVSVTVRHRSRESGPTSNVIEAFFRNSGGAAITSPSNDIDGNFTNYNKAFATAVGGAAWTVALLNSYQVGVVRTGAAAQRFDTSEIDVTVDYIIAGGNLMALTFGLAGLTGAGALLADIRAALLLRTRGQSPRPRYNEREIREAFDIWKGLTWPRYFDLGSARRRAEVGRARPAFLLPRVV